MTLYYILAFLFFIIKAKSLDPDITLLSFVNDGDYYINCVIGETEIDNSTSLFAPLSEEFDIDVRYVPSTPDHENCEFEFDCTNKYIDENWEKQSDDNLLSIIGDIRFEQLETITTKNSKYKIEVKDEDFNLSFSVRAENDPQILFCEDSLSTKKTFCYWNSIDYKKDNYIQYSMRNCSSVKSTTLLGNSKCGKPYNYSHPTRKVNMVQKSDWYHFKVVKKNNELFLYDSLTSELYVKRNLENRNKIKFIYFFTPEGNGQWKIHENSFLKLTTFDTAVYLKPVFSVSNCVSMFVYISTGCTLEIWINNEEKKIYKEANNSWQSIKLISDTKDFKIFVKGTKQAESGTIAIDNIRYCQKDEIRVLSTKIIYNKHNPLNIACKALRNITMYAAYSTTRNDTYKICDDTSYIGRDCNILCSAVFGEENEFCNKNLICKPSNNNQKPQCACASGYNGTICSDLCVNRFGYNCQNQCGKCKDTELCFKSSGHCPNGCEPDYISDDFCLKGKYEPTNLRYTIKENETLNINWVHPSNIDNQFLEYTVYVNKTNGTHLDHSNFIETVKYPNNSCQVTISGCSKYRVEVCGNKNQCTSMKEDISIPPPVPELNSSIKLEDIANETEIITLIIPGIKNGKLCEQSYMYVTVCKISEESKMTVSHEDDEKILLKINCTGTSWIAGRLQTNTNDVKFIVGEGKTKTNIYQNPPLLSNCNICVVLMNEYAKEYSYNDNPYCVGYLRYDQKTILIVVIAVIGVVFLLILIVIVYCVRKHCRKKQEDLENQKRLYKAELNLLTRGAERETTPSG